MFKKATSKQRLANQIAAHCSFPVTTPLCEDEVLDLIFTFREKRKVSHVLALQYDKVIYLLEDSKATRRLIGKYIEVFEYPDGRLELRADGNALPYAIYDRLPEVDQGAIVENKRLGHMLAVAQVMQEQRDSRRGRSAPSPANQGSGSIPIKAKPGKKSQRQLNEQDLKVAIDAAQQTKVVEELRKSV